MEVNAVTVDRPLNRQIFYRHLIFHLSLESGDDSAQYPQELHSHWMVLHVMIYAQRHRSQPTCEVEPFFVCREVASTKVTIEMMA